MEINQLKNTLIVSTVVVGHMLQTYDFTPSAPILTHPINETFLGAAALSKIEYTLRFDQGSPISNTATYISISYADFFALRSNTNVSLLPS